MYFFSSFFVFYYFPSLSFNDASILSFLFQFYFFYNFSFLLQFYFFYIFTFFFKFSINLFFIFLLSFIFFFGGRDFLYFTKDICLHLYKKYAVQTFNFHLFRFSFFIFYFCRRRIYKEMVQDFFLSSFDDK